MIAVIIFAGIAGLALALSYIPCVTFLTERWDGRTQEQVAADLRSKDPKPHKAQRRERNAIIGMWFAATLTILAMAGLFYTVLWGTWNFLSEATAEQFLYKTIALLWGAIYIAFFALLTAWGIGYFAATHMSRLHEGAQEFMRGTCQVLMGIPSILWGLVAVTVIGPFVLAQTGVSGYNILTAGFAVGLMLIPWVTLLGFEGMQQVPKGHLEAALALGLDNRQAYTAAVKPQARPFFWAALIASGGKACTETMVVLMVVGANINLTLNPLETMATPTIEITNRLFGDTDFTSVETQFAFALLALIASLAAWANMYLTYLYSREEQIRKGLRKNGNGLGPKIPIRTPWIKSRLWDMALHLLWLGYHRVAISAVFLLPCFFIGQIALQAWPAAFVTKVTLQCSFEKPVKAMYALADQLGVDYDKLPRRKDSEDSPPSRRDFRNLLAEPRKLVSCGDTVATHSQVDRWFKHQHWPSVVEFAKGTPWYLAMQRNLALETRVGQLLTNGTSTVPSVVGMAQAIIGTVYAALMIALFWAPIGICVAVFLHFWLHNGLILIAVLRWLSTSKELRKETVERCEAWGQKSANLLEGLGNTLLSFPMVGFGLIAELYFISILGLPRGSGLVISLTLGLVAFPYIVLTTMAAIKSVDKKPLLDAGQALGLTYFETIWKVVIPTVFRTIIAAVIFSIVQAVGETAPLLSVGGRSFTTGASLDPMEASSTLSMFIYLAYHESEYGFKNVAAAAALVSLLFFLCLSVLGVVIGHKRKVKRKPAKKHRWWRSLLLARTR